MIEGEKKRQLCVWFASQKREIIISYYLRTKFSYKICYNLCKDTKIKQPNPKKNKGKRETKTRVFILYKNCLLGQACDKLYIYA